MRSKTFHGLIGIHMLPPNEFLSENDWGGLTLMPHVQKQACILFICWTRMH